MTTSEAATRPRGPLWAVLVSTFFGIGRMRPGPGTWGSAATVLLWAAIAYSLPLTVRTPFAIGLAVAVILVGIPAATQTARATGSKDPQFVRLREPALSSMTWLQEFMHFL